MRQKAVALPVSSDGQAIARAMSESALMGEGADAAVG